MDIIYMYITVLVITKYEDSTVSNKTSIAKMRWLIKLVTVNSVKRLKVLCIMLDL